MMVIHITQMRLYVIMIVLLTISMASHVRADSNWDTMSWDQSNWFQDSDGDGVDDSSDAFPYNSSETVDSDGDRMGDNYEILYSFDIGSNTDALLDFDGDGYCNLREFISGTNPKDDTDIP